MSEPKRAASLNPGLLARKGGAIPAPDVRANQVANLDKALVEAATGVQLDDEKNTEAETGALIEKAALAFASAPNGFQKKRPVGCNGRIAMTVRFSQEDHLNLRLLATHLNISSQDILVEAFRGYLKTNGGSNVEQASAFLSKLPT